MPSVSGREAIGKEAIRTGNTDIPACVRLCVSVNIEESRDRCPDQINHKGVENKQIKAIDYIRE